MYKVYRYNPIDFTFRYYNTFGTYTEAAEEAARLTRLYGPGFVVKVEED